MESTPSRIADLTTVGVATQEVGDTLHDRLLALRDRIYASPTFHEWAARLPLVRRIARSRAQTLFDLTAGFVYSQTLATCQRLDLFRILAERPRSVSELSSITGIPIDGMERLLHAAAALELVAPRSAARFGLGALGSPILAQSAILKMVEHNALLYRDLADPVHLLSRTVGDSSAVGAFFPYAETAKPQTLSPETVAAYSELMAQTVAPIAQEMLDARVLEGRQALLDVGGGEGAFLTEAAHRYPSLKLMLFDLPAVVDRAAGRAQEGGLTPRFTFYRGDFHEEALPSGADAISLVRVLLDHDESRVLRLLRRVREALPKNGILIVAEPMTDVAGAHRVGEVYFSFYLRAMGRGRVRSRRELTAMLRDAGFRKSRLLPTRYPVFASIIVATA